MERRSQLLILIGIALLLLAFGVWILLQPFLQKTSNQPPSLPGVSPNATVATSTAKAPLPARPVIAPDIKHVADLAGIFVSRIGSGASGEGFRGYEDVLLNATPAYRQTLKSEQAAMQRVHPASGPAYGVVTRALATDATDAVSGASTVSITVQVQRAEDAGNPANPTSVTTKKVTITFEKQGDGSYLVSNVVWLDIKN